MGATIFEGEFRYGYKYGYFTEFNYKILNLEEQYLNNKKNGYGKEFNKDGSRIINKILIYHDKENTVGIDINTE